ncbi:MULTISPECIES: hypothetical protein [unclassified Methanoculleus]|uniref:hypothetical protein n=1 Tax=unclassified Methanoculleus TaxID=2619537 RepID=UPI0025F0A288|nr:MULTISPECIES: hypothetical protein [unclassified Methanoculleus]
MVHAFASPDFSGGRFPAPLAPGRARTVYPHRRGAFFHERASCAELVGFGLFTWLLLLFAIPFRSPDGEALYGIFLIWSALPIFSAALGTALIVVCFRGVRGRFVREGGRAGPRPLRCGSFGRGTPRRRS